MSLPLSSLPIQNRSIALLPVGRVPIRAFHSLHNLPHTRPPKQAQSRSDKRQHDYLVLPAVPLETGRKHIFLLSIFADGKALGKAESSVAHCTCCSCSAEVEVSSGGIMGGEGDDGAVAEAGAFAERRWRSC